MQRISELPAEDSPGQSPNGATGTQQGRASTDGRSPSHAQAAKESGLGLASKELLHNAKSMDMGGSDMGRGDASLHNNSHVAHGTSTPTLDAQSHFQQQQQQQPGKGRRQQKEGEVDPDDEEHSWLESFACTRISVPQQVWDRLPVASRARNTENPNGAPPQKNRRSIYGLPMIPPYHIVSISWMTLMLVFDVVYTAFWVPLSIGFCLDNFAESLMDPCTQANFFGGIVYTVNIFVSFQLGAVLEYDYQDFECTDGLTLAWCYMRYGRFIIDVLATIPFVLLVVLLGLGEGGGQAATSYVAALSLLRLFRLVRLVSISKVVYLNARRGKTDERTRRLSVTTTYIILLIYLLSVVINLEACIMLMIAYIEGLNNSWLTNLTWKAFVYATHPQQWYCAVYWIITTSTTTGYGDIVPKSVAEQVMANVYMMLGLVFFGLLVGTISNVTTRASKEAARLHNFRKKINRVVHWLQTHNVPLCTRTQVRNYFSRVWASREEMSLDAEIFNDLPHYLRHDLARYVMLPTVSSLRLFKSQDPDLKALMAQYMRPVDIAPGSDLCQQGEEGDRLWIMVEGEVAALQHLAPPVRLVAEPDKPCIFGDSIVMADDIPSARARTFTIRTLNTSLCRVWELRINNLWSIMRMYPNLVMDMMDHVRNRTLIDLAAASREMTEGVVGGHKDYSSWCEAAASISRSLMRQPQEFLDLATEELRKARIEDGSLPQLLDMLLEFSTTHSPRQIDVSAANLSFLTSRGNDSTSNAGVGASSIGIGIGRQQSSGVDLFETAGGPGGASAAGSGVTRTSGSQGGVAGDRVRAALGLQNTKSQWRPGRLGRQTLFRVSSLAAPSRGLASSSIPVQEFGVGYTNFG